MKHFLRFLLFLTPLTTQAQNWEIFNSHDRYNYQAGGAPLITNVLFADSFQVTGSDTIYYLNRIVQKPVYIATYDTVIKNLPQFFQKQIRRSANGTYVFSTDSGYDGFNPDTFTIKAFANKGDSWVYDTIANITATVAGNALQILFGTTDSVKQINLSNGDSILLSKSFGMIGFPSDTLTPTGKAPVYYNLSGIETRGVGDSVINFWSIYNFNVGDVFMYTREEHGVGNADIEYKNTVLAKHVYTDSISYTIRNVYWEHDYPGTTPAYSTIENTTLTYVDSSAHFANSFPNQFVLNPYTYVPYIQYDWHTYSNYLLCTPYFSLPNYNIPCKESFFIFDSIHGNIITGNIAGFPVGFVCEICEGVGNTLLDYGGPESDDVTELIGYIKNGVQYGTVWSDGEITGISSLVANNPVISISPSLTAGYTYVHLSNTATNATLNIAVYDLTGRLIINQPLTSNRTKIDCNNLSPAVYVWRVVDENENVVGTGKLVKQ